MKLLFYTDLHFRNSGSFIPWNKPQENGLSHEINNLIKGCYFVEGMVEELHPDAVFNLGDVYHSMESIDVPTLYGSSLGLFTINSACKKLDIPHFLVEGNHDRYSEASGISSTAILKGFFSGIFSSSEVWSKGVGVVPYYSRPEDVYTNLMEISGFLSSDSLIITHNEFSGAKYENNHETDASLSPDLPIPIVSGHMHLPQKIGNVTYVGSLVQHRFSQFGLNENGIMTFDTSTKETKRFLNNLSKHYVTVRDLEQARSFDPHRVVLKVFSDQPQSEVELILKDYEYSYFPSSEKKEDIPETVVDFQIEDPLSALKAFISQENPEALEIFEKVVKGRKSK